MNSTPQAASIMSIGIMMIDPLGHIFAPSRQLAHKNTEDVTVLEILPDSRFTGLPRIGKKGLKPE